MYRSLSHQLEMKMLEDVKVEAFHVRKDYLANTTHVCMCRTS